MKKTIVASAVLFILPFASAADLADPGQIKPLKEFSPPKPITPTMAQGYMIENQFDRVDRMQYFSVTNPISNGIAPLKISPDSTAKTSITLCSQAYVKPNIMEW